MSESILEAIVKHVVGGFSLQIRMLRDFDDAIEKLRNTIYTTQAQLLDAEDKHATTGDIALNHWVEKLKDAFNDAEDLLDLVSSTDVMTKMDKEVRIFFSCSKQLTFRLKMAQKVNAILERLNDIEIERLIFNIDLRKPPVMRSGDKEELVFGREDDKKAITKVLLDSKDNLSVIPIVGIRGVGKTLLAQLIFKDKNVENHFNLRLWVCLSVSDVFDVKLILKKMVEYLRRISLENPPMDKLQSFVRENIAGKRYLLVLDGVCNEDQVEWLSLKKELMGGDRGSKILITTRSFSAGEIAGTTPPYVLKGLSEEQSWSLLCHVAFEEGREPLRPEVLEYGREIVKICRGLPSMIKLMGNGLSAKRPDASSGIKTIEPFSESSTHCNFLPVLKRKECFAYCSLFPEDCIIDKMTLIKLWMAQGFIHSSNGNQHMEDVGDEYFMSLLRNSLFLEFKKDEWGNVLSCRMDDLIRDAAVFVAGTGSTIVDMKAEIINKRSRHFLFCSSLHSSRELLDQLLKAKKLRTFLLPTQYKGRLDKAIIDKLISRFKYLRVLDLHDSGIEMVPPSIGNLLLLRYLDLSGNEDINLLPTSITRLLNLQTLKLSSCVNLKELPRDIWKLVNLRHLEIGGCKSLAHMPDGLGQLTTLQTLPLFVIGKGTASLGKTGGLSELMGLNNLRGELTILNLGHIKIDTSESNAANLESKGFLQAVRLQWEPIEGDVDPANDEALLETLRPHPNVALLGIEGYMGLNFPSWMKDDIFWCLPNLVAINISRCSKCQHLPSLSHLHCLKTLYVGELTSLEVIEERDHEPSRGNLVGGSGRQPAPSSAVPFSSLKELTLYKLPNLTGWRMRREGVTAKNQQFPLFLSFPCLSKLSIEHCPNLTSMPLFLNLEEDLKLTDVRRELLQQQSMMVKQTIATSLTSSTSLSSSSSSFSSSSFPSFSTYSPFAKLKSLHIASIKDLDGIQWQSLRNLRSLVLITISNLVYLPDEIQYATTLQHLKIVNCSNLMTVPEWMSNLMSLQKLEISQCPNLTSLPDEIYHLQKLIISDCPKLLERSHTETGVDWPKIAHISSLHIT